MTTDYNDQPVIGPDHQLPPPPPRRRAGRVIMWIVLLSIFALGFFLVLRKHDDAATTKKSPRGGGGPVTLTTVTAQKGDIGIYLDAIGMVTAVHYKEGQIVRKGDALIDIDARPYQATLLQAQGTLERDENLLAQGRMDAQRYRDAWNRNAIPKQTLDDQEKLVLQQQGTVKLDQGMLQYDQIQVEYCHIVAPVTGKIGLRLVDPGNVVQSSGTLTLAVIAQLQPITIIFTIPEDNLGQVQTRLQKNAKLSVDALDRSNQKKVASGTLLTLDNQIDTTTGTVKARALFQNKDFALFPNEFVNARLLVDTVHDATLIPTSAIQHNGQAAFVYVVQGDTAHMRSVKPGVTDGATGQVTGISPGDVLANSSFDKLQDNSKVVVSGKPAPPGGSAPSGASGSNKTPGSSAP